MLYVYMMQLLGRALTKACEQRIILMPHANMCVPLLQDTALYFNRGRNHAQLTCLGKTASLPLRVALKRILTQTKQTPST